MIPKRKIRCYITLASVAPNIYNYPVYSLFHEGWSNFSLVTCSNCGELFVIDWENPKTKGLTMRDIAASNNCPSCNSPLRDTLQDYPQTIKLPNGQSGSFTPDKSIPPNEILVVEFFELVPWSFFSQSAQHNEHSRSSLSFRSRFIWKGFWYKSVPW